MIRKNSITPIQFFFVLLMTQISTFMIFNQKNVIQVAGNTAYLDVLIAGILKQLIIVAIWYSVTKMKKEDKFNVLNYYFGNKIGYALNLLYALYFFLIIIFLVTRFAKSVNVINFPLTPTWVFILLGITIVFWTGRFDLQSHSYMYGLSSFFVIVTVFVCIFSLGDVNLEYLFPFFNKGASPFIEGIWIALSSVIGFEVMIYYMSYVETDKAKKMLTAATAANAVVTLNAILGTFSFIISFHEEELDIIHFPLLTLAKSFNIGIISRYDILYFIPWLWLVFIGFISYSFLLNNQVYNLVRQKFKIKSISWIIAVGLFLVALNFTNIARVLILHNVLNWFFVVMAIAIPLVTFCISLIKKEVKTDV